MIFSSRTREQAKSALFPLGYAWAVGLAGVACGSTAEPSLPMETDDIPAAFDVSQSYEPGVVAEDLATEITNTLFPNPIGATWTYEAETEDGLERIEIVVEGETYDVAAGVVARVVRDTSYFDDVLAEDTRDWYGQDAAGNVWYLGEDTAEYDASGEVSSTAGSWEWGVSRALPGVVMLAEPREGDVYRQEYFEAEAQDFAEVVSTDEAVTVPAGSFEGCIKTRDRSVLDPELDEFKYYCAGVGNVLVEEGGDVRVELIEFSGL